MAQDPFSHEEPLFITERILIVAIIDVIDTSKVKYEKVEYEQYNDYYIIKKR